MIDMRGKMRVQSKSGGLGRISQVADDDTTHYYLSDGLGSTMALTDADGDVVNTYDYDVFGPVRASSGSQPNEFQFTGEQVDDSTTLEYLRARYYDPVIGRFLTQDPFLGSAMAPLSLNRYPYVLNNPLRWLDPWGLRNVEGKLFATPTLTPIGATMVCGPAVHEECKNRKLVVPPSGSAFWDVLGDVWGAYKAYYRHTPDYLFYEHVAGPAWEFATSREPGCYVRVAALGVATVGLVLETPEGAPVWSGPMQYTAHQTLVTQTLVSCSDGR
jgi:RHS repeat-associated protein